MFIKGLGFKVQAYGFKFQDFGVQGFSQNPYLGLRVADWALGRALYTLNPTWTCLFTDR